MHYLVQAYTLRVPQSRPGLTPNINRKHTKFSSSHEQFFLFLSGCYGTCASVITLFGGWVVDLAICMKKLLFIYLFIMEKISEFSTEH